MSAAGDKASKIGGRGLTDYTGLDRVKGDLDAGTDEGVHEGWGKLGEVEE